MKSIKPGRGPSMMGGFGALASVAFGVIWTLAAINMGAPVFFPLFGLVFIALGVGQAIYNFRNAKGKNRYSAFDIVDSDEEDDPLNRRYGARHEDAADSSAPSDGSPCHCACVNCGALLTHDQHFCPYCGAPAEEGFAFCRRCGKKLPK